MDSSGGIADQLAGMPEVWQRLLAAHVPDRTGRCAGCRSADGAGARWPCSLHGIASAAQRTYGAGLSGGE